MTDDHEQKFDFGFEEEDTIEGMKKLIVEEVTSFRAEVRAHARAAGQIRRQDRFVLFMNDIIYILLTSCFTISNTKPSHPVQG
jgi:mitogen-activated protein kinase 7